MPVIMINAIRWFWSDAGPGAERFTELMALMKTSAEGGDPGFGATGH